MNTIQELVDSKSNLIKYFHNNTSGVLKRSFLSSLAEWIEPEYTNWREEQRAWRETVILFDQSHHMSATYLKGPDAKRMLNYLSPCTFSNLSTNRGKHYFVDSPYGKHIGDCILHYYGEEDGFELLSSSTLQSWILYHAQTGEYNVEAIHDPASPLNPEGERRKFRFQIEGPAARAVLDEACKGGWPELKFFNTTFVEIAGCKVHVLRHGMAGHAGAELSGSYKDKNKVYEALLKFGAKHGIKRGGTAAYFSSALESGWIPNPFPAIFTGEALKPYREWLSASAYEGGIQLSGSLVTDNVEDYYWDAWSLGYDKFVAFDHDFISRKATEEEWDKPHRVRRSLEFAKDDVMRVIASQFEDGPRYKSIDMPVSVYGSGTSHADEILSSDGKRIGVSQWVGYSANERCMISNCCVDEEFAEPGTEVVVIWGEPNGGSNKDRVERHVQTSIRARVSPSPFSKVSRSQKRAVL